MSVGKRNENIKIKTMLNNVINTNSLYAIGRMPIIFKIERPCRSIASEDN